jgi:hypothetical protein
MSQNQTQREDPGQSPDATTDGGAGADRGGRDAGMPGPARGQAPAPTPRVDDSTGSADTDSMDPAAGGDPDQQTNSLTRGKPLT